MMDIYSRYVWVRPLKRKSEDEVLENFKSVLENHTLWLPSSLWTDRGTEFYNKKMNKFLKSLMIAHYSTFSEFKVSPVERFIRTLKGKLWEEFAFATRNWVDELDDIVRTYNNTKHSTTRHTPFEVYTGEKSYVPKTTPRRKTKKNLGKLKEGDAVRISRLKGTFEKGFHGNWSHDHEIFKVRYVHPTEPTTYSLTSYDGEPIKGTFYRQELQKLDEIPEVFPVEKIVKKGKNKSLVKWLGWPERFNTWEPNEEIKELMKK
jgi:hypothetical protein